MVFIRRSIAGFVINVDQISNRLPFFSFIFITISVVLKILHYIFNHAVIPVWMILNLIVFLYCFVTFLQASHFSFRFYILFFFFFLTPCGTWRGSKNRKLLNLFLFVESSGRQEFSDSRAVSISSPYFCRIDFLFFFFLI